MTLNTHTAYKGKHKISKRYDQLLRFLKLSIIKSISLLIIQKLFKFPNSHIIFNPRRSELSET